MKQGWARLAAVAGVVVLTAGLPAMAGAASGAGRQHGVARPASGLSRLERLSRGALFRMDLSASPQAELTDVDIRARADGWAVGTQCASRCQRGYTLIERWNGRRWSRVPSPNVAGVPIHLLSSVQAVSARDAWAVGVYLTKGDQAIRTLIEHWNGRRWTLVPSPDPSAGAHGISVLQSVTAVSARDAWAAGVYGFGSAGLRPLLLHWNGVRWSVAPSPHKSSVSELNAVTAISARDAWAVGDSGELSTSMLLMHWNGVRWSLVPGLHVQGTLASVSAVSARDAWAAGLTCPDRCDSDNPPSRTLLLHWNGVRWAHAASPEPGTESELTGVSARSATDAWAVGDYCRGKCIGPEAGGALLLLHWNGARWTRVARPGLTPGRARLSAVSVLSARQAWAVGLSCSKSCALGGTVVHPLIVRWNGLRWVSEEKI